MRTLRNTLFALLLVAAAGFMLSGALAEGWWVDGDGVYYHAAPNCALARDVKQEADSYATFAADMGTHPCPACVPGEAGDGVKAWERGGTVIVRLPDEWIEGRLEEESAPDEPSEGALEMDDWGDGDLSRLLNGERYLDYLNAAAPGTRLAAGALAPECADESLLVMSRRHLGGAWWMAVRPDKVGRDALKKSGKLALPLRLWQVPLFIDVYETGATCGIGDGTRRREMTLDLAPEKASGEEAYRQDGEAGDDYGLYVLRDGDLNTLVLRERDQEEDGPERLAEYCRSRFKLKGYLDGSDAVYVCAVTDGELEQLKNRLYFDLYAVPLWRTDGGGAAAPEQLGEDYAPVSATTRPDGTGIALAAAEYPVGVSAVTCLVTRPRGGVGCIGNVARLETLSGDRWYPVGDVDLEGYLDGDPNATRPGWLCDAMTVTWPLEGLGVLKEGLYRVVPQGEDWRLEFRVRDGAPQPAAPVVKHRERDFELAPHAPAWTDGERYNSCQDNSRVFTGDGWRLLAGDVVYEWKGVDVSWGWGIHTHYSLFAWPVGQPERAARLIDDFDHSEVALWDLGDGLLLADDEFDLWRCDLDGGNLRALERPMAGQSPLAGGDQILEIDAESYRIRSLLPAGDGLYLATEGGVWRAGPDGQNPARVYRAESEISNYTDSAMVYADGRLLVDDGGLVALDAAHPSADGTLPARRLTENDHGWDGSSGFDYIALNGRAYFWSEDEGATVSMDLDGGDVQKVSKERFWFWSVTPSGVVLALSGTQEGLFGDDREAADFYYPADPANPVFDPDHCQKRPVDPEAFDYFLGDWLVHTDAGGAETWTPLAEWTGYAAASVPNGNDPTDALLPAPSGDLSFLSDYVDAVRVGDWFLACAKATEPEGNHDSATRNATAPWVLLDEGGRVLAEELYWWPKGVEWPLHPRPFEGFEVGVYTAVIRVGQKYGLIDRSGVIAVEPVYDNIFGFNPGDTSTPVEKDGRWGAIDDRGHVIVPIVYDVSFSRFEDGCTVAERGGKQALLGEDGGEILPAEYDEVWLEDGAKYGMARRGGTCMLFDRQGNILFERELGDDGWIYCWADAEPPFAYFDGKNEKNGYLNLDGADALPAIYDEAGDFDDATGTALVQLNGKWGMVRRDGSFAIPAEYDSLGGFSGGLCPAEKGGLWGYLDEDGDAAIPFQFAWAGGFKDGYADACPAGSWSAEGDYSERPEVHGLIDPAGAWVIEPRPCNNISLGADGVAVVSAYEGDAYFRMKEGGAEEIVALPCKNDDRLATLDGEETLKKRVSGERLPHLDGAARLYPLYAAYVKAVYPKNVEFEAWDYDNDPMLTQSGEDNPWQRLSDGDADIIFVPAPDPEASIWATFAARGQEPVFVPLCRDAVVFPVEADNPVEDIAGEDLERIYTGDITRWDDLGGRGDIVAYQDDENAEARAIFERVCHFGDLMPAPEGVTGYDSWAGEVFTGPVPFRCLPGAVGYALRSQCRGLGDAVRLLSVDGVAPTDENLADGSYPYAETLYAVYLKDNANPNVAALLDWIQSDQGAELAVKTGFSGSEE